MPCPIDQANHAPSGEKSTLQVSHPARPTRDGGRLVFSSRMRAGSDAAGKARRGNMSKSHSFARSFLRRLVTRRRDDNKIYGGPEGHYRGSTGDLPSCSSALLPVEHIVIADALSGRPWKRRRLKLVCSPCEECARQNVPTCVRLTLSRSSIT